MCPTKWVQFLFQTTLQLHMVHMRWVRYHKYPTHLVLRVKLLYCHTIEETAIMLQIIFLRFFLLEITASKTAAKL